MRHLVEPVIGTVDVPSRSLVKTPFKIRPMVTVFEEGPIINYFNCKVNDKIISIFRLKLENIINLTLL